ncbi:MAG: tautomerase family protein [Marinisporobacter sp.]|jgi:4-oxalocrotonate tautomerase family enzyme|nr:tautomerase family protein [Marinisporobacter sp.]
MPIINVQTTPLTKEQKSEMIRRMTQVTSEVTGAPEEQKKELISRLVEVSMDITGTPEYGNAVMITELPLNALGVGKKTAAEVFGNK